MVNNDINEVMYVKITTEEYRELITDATDAKVRLEVENRNVWKVESERDRYRESFEKMRDFIESEPEIASKYAEYINK